MAGLRNRLRAALRAWKQPSRGARNAFAGAATNRLSEWIYAPTLSADQEIRGDLRVLRARARELVRNNPYAARFVDLVAENVIGEHGIRLQAQVKRADGNLDEETNSRIETAWREWSAPAYASIDGRLSWVDLQQLALQSIAQDGELLMRMIPGAENPFGFSLQVLDPDQLDPDYNRTAGEGRNEIRMSVEIDRWGKPVAYWILSAHPSDYTARDRVRERIPAAQVIHEFFVRRPGQTRGVTWFAPVILDAKMHGGWTEAALVAARAGASQMGFITQSAEAVADPNADGADEPITMEAEPGVIATLQPGQEFQGWNPAYPNTAFGEFSKAILRSIATGLKVSYNTLANDLEGVNYSSLRAGLLSERDAWRRLQSWTYCHLHDRIYPEWLKWALTTGALELPSRQLGRWTAHRWLPRGWPWVDPLKDVQADGLAVALGFDSPDRVVGEQGLELDEIYAGIARARELAASYGLSLATVSSVTAGGATDGTTDGGDPSGSAAGGSDRAGRRPGLRVERARG